MTDRRVFGQIEWWREEKHSLEDQGNFRCTCPCGASVEGEGLGTHKEIETRFKWSYLRGKIYCSKACAKNLDPEGVSLVLERIRKERDRLESLIHVWS